MIPKFQVTCSRERYEELSSNPQFWATVNLSRVVNSLRNARIAPLLRREMRIIWAANPNEMFDLGAHLFEAIECVHGRLGQHLRHLEAFRPLSCLLKSQELRGFKEGFLRRVRNKVGFHFDTNVAPLAAERFPWQNFVLREYQDPAGTLPYYPFGDYATLYSALGGDCSSAEAREKIEEYLNLTGFYADKILDLCDALLEESFQVLGLEERREPEDRKW